MSDDQARGLSRRGFLKGTAAVSLGTAATAAGITPAGVQTAAAAEPGSIPPHGAELRGLDLVIQDPTAEGRFGFMFKNQRPLRVRDGLVNELGGIDEATGAVMKDAVMKERPAIGDIITYPSDGTATVTATKDHNDIFNENPSEFLTSGFTFVGQFVDHDITFDRTPVDQQQSDPLATTNFRTPRYDLDSIYGLGPNADPSLYKAADRDKFDVKENDHTTVFGLKVTNPETPNKVYAVKPITVRDVPRDSTTGKASIGDPRNDQTLILLQLHVAFQMFHNKLVDRMRALRVPPASVFESARRMARWHYQWMVIHEFLPAIVGQDTADSVYKEVSTGAPIIDIKYYKPTNSTGRPFIPVEFSVAAYRFGHSMTRARYTVQDVITAATETPPSEKVAVSSVPLFEASASYNNLNGSRPVPARLKMQWSKFFNDPLAKNADGTPAPRTARPVRQFDASLGDPLFQLPPSALPDKVTAESLLSVRNLRRGQIVGLPSGQQVAGLMGVTPLTNAELSWRHRIEIKWPIIDNKVAVNRRFKEVDTRLESYLADPEFGGEAPLWFYILKEAEILGQGERLGPVGGRIVAEVLVGLLQKDPNSYLYLQPNWKPQLPIARENGKFRMADLLRYAGVWS